MLKPQAVISATYKAPFLKGLSAKISYSRSWVHDLNKIYYTNYDLYQVKKSRYPKPIFSTKVEDIIGRRRTPG